MARYRIITLVDITKSDATRTETDRIKIGQQANFNSLIQALGLRSNIEWNKDPEMMTGSLPLPLTGKANHWIWEFEVERDNVYLKDDDPIGFLKEDLQGVPIVDRLNNSTDIFPAMFQTTGERINLWVSVVE